MQHCCTAIFLLPSVFSSILPDFFFFFFNDTATTEIYTLSLHDALPIYLGLVDLAQAFEELHRLIARQDAPGDYLIRVGERSEEHTSELQSHVNLVCRLLLEKKKKKKKKTTRL